MTQMLSALTNGRPDWPTEQVRLMCLRLADLDGEDFERALSLAEQQTLEAAMHLCTDQGDADRAWEIEREIRNREMPAGGTQPVTRNPQPERSEVERA